MIMISEKEAEERRLRDVPDGIAVEDASDDAGGGCAGEIPHADLHGAGHACPEPVEAIPTYSMYPTGSHPWSVSSEDRPAQPFSQARKWEFDLKNTTGYESVIQRIEWDLAPSTSVLQGADIRLSAYVDGAPAVGMNQLPVGQGASLGTQLRIPSEGRLVVRVSALSLPVQQADFPGRATDYLATARIGQKCFVAGGLDNVTGLWVSEVWATGDWGASWVQLPDAPWVPTGIVSMVHHDGTLVALVTEAAAVSLWASSDNGISWTQWIADVSVIDALFVAPLTPAQLVVVGGTICAPFWDAGNVEYVTFRTTSGGTVASWEKVTAYLGAATGADAGRCIEYAGKLVMTDSEDGAGNLQVVVSPDLGETWTLVDTLIGPGTGCNLYTHGRQLWVVNGLWTHPPAWTDDLLNFHLTSAAAWNKGRAGRTGAAVFADESRVLCLAGQANGDPGVPLHDVWSGGMVYPISDTVLHPRMRCSGFFLPPEC